MFFLSTEARNRNYSLVVFNPYIDVIYPAKYKYSYYFYFVEKKDSSLPQIPKVIIAPETLTMVEVFKTNIDDLSQANRLLDHIHNTCVHYKANFDLEDCDRILRVKCTSGKIEPDLLIELVREWGFIAEVLPD